MNELIWFSIPGAILLVALYHVLPGMENVNSLLTVTGAPVIGYIVHQTYRTLFEIQGGWESSKREVLNVIASTYKLTGNGMRQPFLVWETTFYSEGIPNSFRDHNRGSWHYIMSFRSVSFSALIAAVLFTARILTEFFLGSCSLKCGDTTLIFIVISLILAMLFWKKASLTYSSLTRQEVAAFHEYREAFDKTAQRIINK